MKKKRKNMVAIIVALLLVIVGLLLIIDPFHLRNDEEDKNTKKTTTTKTETKKTEEKKDDKKEEKKEDKKTTEETKKTEEKKTEETKKTEEKSKSNNTTTTTKIDDSEIVGKWSTAKAVSSEDGTEVTNLREIFGSSYSQYGSYLELKDDGTFVDAIEPTSRSDSATKGTYVIERNYNKEGDCYIFLTYSDGTTDKLRRLYLDESKTPYLALDGLIHDYKIYLKK